MQDFHPTIIYVDHDARDLPVTQRILAKFPRLPVIEIADKSAIKYPQEHTHAKKQLYISTYQGDPVKSCQGMGDYVCCQYFTIALVSDCHLECTYCILQDYLKNNPVITMYANIDDIFKKIRERISKHPERLFRIGTGELSDSLALDHITGFSKDIVAFGRENPNVLLELKSKTANVDKLMGLDHGGRTVVSWSLNPQKYIASEEHKCDTLDARLNAARRCADEGYPVGFHLDPLIHYQDWREQYDSLTAEIAKRFRAEEIAWISVGSLRFTPELKKIVRERFPKSRLMSGELVPSLDGKTRYFRNIREEMYATVTGWLNARLDKTPNYLCMETKPVWKNVINDVPLSNAVLEKSLTQNFTGLKNFTV